MKKYLLIGLCCWLFQLAKAQDPRFSQFLHTPHHTNPALIGVYEGSFRAAITYREQWNTLFANVPFRTSTASFDVRRPVGKGDFVGIGVALLQDKVHVSNFTQDRAHLGLSYMKQLGRGRYKSGAQYLIVAGQVGYGQNGFDAPNLWFSDQFDVTTTTIAFPTGENFDNLRSPTFMDFNAGLLWYNLFDKNKSIYVGGAAHHLTQPDISFFEDGERSLERRYVAQIGGELPLSDGLSLLPSFMGMQQGSATNLIAGANVRYTQKEWKEIALRLGGWTHVANKLENGLLLDAVVVMAVLETERLAIAASYDLNASNLSRATNARGAFELSLIYLNPPKGRKWQVNCPRF